MGMSTHVYGIKNNTEEYKKHKAVLLACYEAEIEELPIETAKFFGIGRGEVDIDILDEYIKTNIPNHPYSDSYSEGFDVIVSEIPKDIYIIRFVNSY